MFDVLHVYSNFQNRHQLWNRKEGNVLFNDTLNTFYLRLYGVGFVTATLWPPFGLSLMNIARFI